jgi:hypothetical protein
MTDKERFNLRKISELEVRKQYQIKIVEMFPSMENLNDSNGKNGTWKNIK